MTKFLATQNLKNFWKNIIGLSSKSSDIILDFFLGSGTTAAVAHKMNRKYIGIEQMDYIQDIGCWKTKESNWWRTRRNF
nr:DNA methyltransferase [Mycoplasmopsis bovis]